MPLLLDTRVVGDVLVVTCRGRITSGYETILLHDQVKSLIPEIPEIVLQLAETGFVDSCGMGTLVRLLSSARMAGGDIKLCAVQQPVLKTLRITNLHTLFEIYESEAAAIAACHQPCLRKNEGPSSTELRIVCVDESADVLAYLSELLRRAGYRVLTCRNLVDARLLLKAAAPRLAILGPRLHAREGESGTKILQDVASAVPVTVLDEDFSTLDAGAAGQRLLERVRSLISTS